MTAASTIESRAAKFLAELANNPEGSVSSSIYETARILTLAPWLTGAEERLRFLLQRQDSNGTWGGTEEYALVPTLSAVEALLATLIRVKASSPSWPELVEATEAGLIGLGQLLAPQRSIDFADMIASELIVPRLIADINTRLGRLAMDVAKCPQKWTEIRFEIPPGADCELLNRLSVSLPDINPKLHHSLEIFGERAARVVSARPLAGNVGCSPAATAAWLGNTISLDHDGLAVRYLENLVRRYSGPVPGVAPTRTFEYGWALSTLLSAGIQVKVPTDIFIALDGALTEDGAAVGAGLLCDSDTTSVTLFALAQAGRVQRPDVLFRFDKGTHFCCWPDERNPSVSANAHVLETFVDYLERCPDDSAEFRSAARRIAAWLCTQQRADGSWSDKWHMSPFYATLVCIRGLERAGSSAVVDKAVEWVLRNQRLDGSWGYQRGTVEETAYAVQALLRPRSSRSEDVMRAALRGSRFLSMKEDSEYPPLWYDKDLYAPIDVIRAEVLAALHLVKFHSAGLEKRV